MIRNNNYRYIEEKLGVLAYRIGLNGKLNDLSLHVHSENFYLHLLQHLYGWPLENCNAFKQNVEAIDLVCHDPALVVQVSATSTKQKVESALAKPLISNYPGYTFKFISIANPANKLRKQQFQNPHAIAFDPAGDIIDNKSVLDGIMSLDIVSMNRLYDFIKAELGAEVDIVLVDTNLAEIINILSQEPLEIFDGKFDTEHFTIDNKINYNGLDYGRSVIEDYSINSYRLAQKYNELDREGVSYKSTSILQKVRSLYQQEARKSQDPDEILLSVISQVKELVTASRNYTAIRDEELDMCVKTVVVDAFMRCKIFEKPD